MSNDFFLKNYKKFSVFFFLDLIRVISDKEHLFQEFNYASVYFTTKSKHRTLQVDFWRKFSETLYQQQDALE